MFPREPFSLLFGALLFLASGNQHVDRHFDQLTLVIRNTREAIQNIRRGIQVINQGLLDSEADKSEDLSDRVSGKGVEGGKDTSSPSESN